MKLHERIRAALPDCAFRPPATEDQIRRVERELGITLPEEVRRLYLHYDGFHCRDGSDVEILPLLAGRDNVLDWSEEFRNDEVNPIDGGGAEGIEPEDLLFLGFLDQDQYIAVDLRTNRAVKIWRRGAEVEVVDEDLSDLFRAEHEERSRFRRALDEHVYKGRTTYRPVKPGEGIQRDIDRVILGYQEDSPTSSFLKQDTTSAAEPGGTWVLPVGYDPGWEQVRLKSSDGNCPFVVESDITRTTAEAGTVGEAVSMIRSELKKYRERWRQEDREPPGNGGRTG